MIRALVICAALVTTACGPISPERAAEQCEERAREAAGPTTEIGIRVNSDGRVTSGISIGITSDFLTGKDPEQVYVDCVEQKTGQPPIRPLKL